MMNGDFLATGGFFTSFLRQNLLNDIITPFSLKAVTPFSYSKANYKQYD